MTTIPYDPNAASEAPDERPVIESGDYNATMKSCKVNDRNEYEIDWVVYHGADEVYLRQWLNMAKGFHIHHLGCIARHLGMEEAYRNRTFNPASGVGRNFKIKVAKKPARNNPGKFRNWVDGIDDTVPASQQVMTPAPAPAPAPNAGGDHKPVDDSDIPF